MKYLILIFIIISINGYSDDLITTTQCPNDINIPKEIVDKLEVIQDNTLLNNALGKPTEGGLCQGKVYQTKKDTNITIYRAWNSTNLNSEMGKWWAFDLPKGKRSEYRSDYEICYQWSPLDKMTSCTLKPNTKIVLGSGQSAKCSTYLTYDTSTKTQVYIENALSLVSNCTTYDAVFSWIDVRE